MTNVLDYILDTRRLVVEKIRNGKIVLVEFTEMQIYLVTTK